MMRKLLLYSYDWWPLVGGIQTATLELARGICEWSKAHLEGAWEVTLVTQTPADGMDDFALPFRVVRRPSILQLSRLFLSADVVHLAGPTLLPMLLSWLLARRTVIEHHNYQSVCPNGLLIFQSDLSICPGHYMAGHYGKCLRCNSIRGGWRSSLLALLLMFPRRWLARRANVHVAPSRHMQQRAQLPRAHVIYHGVADSPSSAASSGTKEETPPCFAFVGRLVEEKGVAVLLRAAADLYEGGYHFRLKIVGDGPERPALEGLAEQLKIDDRTEFKGAVSHALVPAVLADVAAIVMPSTWEDVAPLVALEQMAQGRLLIVSDIGGLGETVDGFGLKFPAGNAAALASCMRQVVDNPLLPSLMGQKARSHALVAYSLERMVEEHLTLYQAVARSAAK
jgi:glycosyltransferase involved in cell wall biosynthesis